MRQFVFIGAATLGIAVLVPSATPAARQSVRIRPIAVLEPATPLSFPGDADSNSPAFWFLFQGLSRLVVFNSSTRPTVALSAGPDLSGLSLIGEALFRGESHRRWMEAIVPDDAGRLYGYYHNEPGDVCDDSSKTIPRIGAARSLDGGRSWTDLGFVLEAAPGEPDCETPNLYFAGGVGDFSVVLDGDGNDLYFLVSSYGPAFARQGIAVARMRWSDRDAPQGQLAVWSDGIWRYPEPFEEGWIYPAPSPVLPAETSWHNRAGTVGAFWGPSVHWNTFLNRYVMLLNRAGDVSWTQEGIYISITQTIQNPASWSVPQKLLDGGRWYPQVIGLEPGSGTDRLAGERARFFMGGESQHEIVFHQRGDAAVPRGQAQ